MKEDVKDKWISELEGDNHQQGKDFLNKYGKKCCLGVLTDIYIKEHNLEWKHYDAAKKDLLTFDDEGWLLPARVCHWAGLKETNPYILSMGDTLSGLNDSGKTFKEIAQLIKLNL